MTMTKTPRPSNALSVITEKGLKMLKDDTQMDDDTRLSLEIAARCPEGLTDNELDWLVDEAIELYGSACAAVTALKRGEIEPVNAGRGT
jgi:hypothetical protein